MSAEAPKRTGVFEFLRRAFAGPSTSPVATQPPPELSDFTVGLRKAIVDVTNNLDTTNRQAESNRIEQERRLAESITREKELKVQQEQQETERRLKAFEEMKQLAENLKIKDRLVQINATAWEGKGQVQDISTSNGVWYNDNPMAGFELIFFYKTAGTERKTRHYDDKPQNFVLGYSWRFVEVVESTSLKIYISSSLAGDGTSIVERLPNVGKGGKRLCVLSSHISGRQRYVGLNPPNREGIEDELDQILIDESIQRVRGGTVPSKLTLTGRGELRKAKATLQWYRWEYVHTHVYEND